MKDEALLRSMRKINGIDVRAIKSTIRVIRHLREYPIANDLADEMENLCFWWGKRRENRREILALAKGGAA